MDLYELLEVDPRADEGNIREALKQQRRKWVSRTSSAPDLARRQEAERMVDQLDKAEKTLLDPHERARYDRQREIRPAGDSAAVADPQADDPETWASRAERSLQGGSPRLALHEIDQALRLDHLRARYHLFRGEVLNRIGAWDEALACFQTAYELDPHAPAHQVLLGAQYLLGGRYAAALPLLEHAMAGGGATPEVRVLMGEALYGLADQAADHLRDGTPVIVHPRQAADVAGLCGRALGLAPPDQELAARLARLHGLALAATQRVFDWQRLISGAGTMLSAGAAGGCGCLLVMVAIPFAILYVIVASLRVGAPAFGFVLLLMVGGAVTAFCHRPRWAVTERDTRPWRIPRVR